MINDAENYFQSKLLMSPPSSRAAFSDRRAWLLAELSRLSYFPFEGGNHLENFTAQVEHVVDNTVLRAKVIAIAAITLGDAPMLRSAAEQSFSAILTDHGFTLVGTFSENETQGFVAKKDNAAYLIYRGSESLGDIKSCLRGVLTKAELNGITAEVHSGFWQQFMDVHSKVEALLEEVKDCQLYIGGHSLGGALANIATKFYANDSSGSTYTFGAPAISPPGFQDTIRTPIYRIINARDPVPLLPNPALIHAAGLLWSGFTLAVRFIGTEHQKKVAGMLKDLARISQIGYSSRIIYLAGEPKLRYSFGIFQRISLWIGKPWSHGRLEKQFSCDHKIARYCYALRRWGEARVNGN
ncbi:lipase family protein [Teredinibacter purpureus]|uniref:lipase family protein n=1 Tax=Teredinibacter purpureus TaxID=2731756 RepID=UPI0005F799E7|nr:lipase family protein [Teredinibacter purpureus]